MFVVDWFVDFVFAGCKSAVAGSVCQCRFKFGGLDCGSNAHSEILIPIFVTKLVCFLTSLSD